MEVSIAAEKQLPWRQTAVGLLGLSDTHNPGAVSFLPPLSGFLHRGASWMQISGCRLVGATLQAISHWAQTFWCVLYLFLSQLSHHFRHAANPKIVLRCNKGTEARKWANVKHEIRFFMHLFFLYQFMWWFWCNFHFIPLNPFWYEHKTFLNTLSWD